MTTSAVFTEPSGALATVQPAGVLTDYVGDFSSALEADSDTLASVTVTVSGSATIDEGLSTVDTGAGTATTWVNGGEAGELVIISWAVTTAAGREQVFKLKVYYE